MNKSPIHRLIDHTLLKTDATSSDIERLCAEALEHHFATVCVRPEFVSFAAQRIKGSDTLAITVVGFPTGTVPTALKVQETLRAVQEGAGEIDMVVQIDALQKGDYGFVFEDISAVVQAAGPIPVKVILETAHLNEDQKIAGCVLSKAAGAAFVKTSTGFGRGGATVEDILLMRRIVGPDMGVKASGGVRNRADAEKMIQAGANRLGTSAGVAIISSSSQKETPSSY